MIDYVNKCMKITWIQFIRKTLHMFKAHGTHQIRRYAFTYIPKSSFKQYTYKYGPRARLGTIMSCLSIYLCQDILIYPLHLNSYIPWLQIEVPLQLNQWKWLRKIFMNSRTSQRHLWKANSWEYVDPALKRISGEGNRNNWDNVVFIIINGLIPKINSQLPKYVIT